jgi:hypothetical protein
MTFFGALADFKFFAKMPGQFNVSTTVGIHVFEDIEKVSSYLTFREFEKWDSLGHGVKSFFEVNEYSIDGFSK